ncbi:MAG: gamma-glutamyl-gamma-aminobutyrate hydrolase family protein [Bacteroides sp.]|nr:gamma-glutamyl-gamma-aminobutyrate hydrolase family protein [Bacteroides sp.]
MRKIKWILILLLMLQACKSSQEPVIETPVFVEGEKHFVIMHPTVNNLRTFLFLKGEGIFPLPEEFRVVGVYHESGSYDYQQSAEFLREQGIENIALMGISPILNPGNLYSENACTPAFREVFEESEGIIFFGGPDIPPAAYGEPMDLLTVVTDPNRHFLEISMLFHLLGGSQNEGFTPFLEEKPGYGILGICLGMQSMNVATGGTMVQDIPTEIYGLQAIEDILETDHQMRHRNYQTNYSLDHTVSYYEPHQVDIVSGHLAEINKDEPQLPYVLSSHHQAADKIGKGLKVTAWSMDGKIVEALEHEKYPHVLGVQFHPEMPYIYQRENKITMVPYEPGDQSYLELYPGELGENFHYKFWKHIAGWYFPEKE